MRSFFTFCILSALVIYPQVLSSQSSVRIEIDTILSRAHRSADSTVILANQAYDLAKSKDSTLLMIKSLKVLDEYYFSNRDDQGTANTLRKLALLYEEIDDINSAIKMYVYLCMPYRNMKKYDSLMISYTNGMALAESHDLELPKASLYLELGDYYKYGMNDQKKAIEYLKRALPIYKSGGEESQIGLSRIYHDLAKTYHTEGMLDSTEKYVDLGIELGDKIGKKSVIEIMNSLKADFLVDTDRYEEALPYAMKSYELAKEINNQEAIAFSSSNIAKARIALGLVDKTTEDHINIATNAADYMGVFSYQQVEAYTLSSEYYELQGDYKNALEKYKYVVMINDSIRQQALDQDLQRLTHEHEIREKETELQLVEEKNQAAKRMNVLLLGFVGLFSLLGLILWNRVKLKQKLNRQRLDKLEADKAKEEVQLKLLKAEQKVEEEKNQALSDRVHSYERELASTMLFISKKNEALTSIKAIVDNFQKKPTEANSSLTEINNLINRNSDTIDDWEAFKLRFEKVHPRFFSELSHHYPTLNTNDKRLLSYIKMGMDNGEIARITGINISSIYKSRYRIRKKLNLSEQVDLNELIGGIS